MGPTRPGAAQIQPASRAPAAKPVAEQLVGQQAPPSTHHHLTKPDAVAIGHFVHEAKEATHHAEEVLDESSSLPTAEEEAAAARIQARQRGKTARRGRRRAPPPAGDGEIYPSPSTAETAATRIQSIQRGKQARRQAKATKIAAELPPPSAPPPQKARPRGGRGRGTAPTILQPPEPQSPPVLATKPAPSPSPSPEEQAAAVRIQARQRGKLARRRREKNAEIMMESGHAKAIEVERRQEVNEEEDLADDE